MLLRLYHRPIPPKVIKSVLQQPSHINLTTQSRTHQHQSPRSLYPTPQSTMSSSPASKRQKTTSSDTPSPPYELLYWPTIPGRGEFIRLCFEETRTPYTDTCNIDQKPGMKTLTSLISASNTGDAINPPPFAPPVLRHGDLLVSQTPNILLYLAPKLGLAGPVDDDEDPNAIYHVNQLALTALDGLSNEAHDTHHPIAPMSYYEEQKDEAKRKAADYLSNRLPKFLSYFERVLQGEASKGGEWLYGGQLTYADLVLWQCMDGLSFAFPVAVGRMRKGGEFGRVFGLCERVRGRENIRAYLESGRRLGYGNGIYRHYPELDEEEK